MENKFAELDERLEELETTGLGKSLTRNQIITFTTLCLLLPAIVAIIGGIVFS